MSNQTEWTDEFERVEGRIRDWQQNHPKPTLAEMQTAVDAELAGMRTRIINDILKEHEEREAHPQCPRCQRPMVRNGKRKQRLQDKEDTEIVINRTQMRCQQCGLTLFPLDEQLGLLAGRQTPRVQEATTRLGSKLPYREAIDELARMLGVTLSVGTVRTVTDASGQAAQAVRIEQVKQLQEEAAEPEQGAAKLTISADGAMVQLTSGEWAEVKTMVVGEHRQVWQAKQSQIETKVEQVSYFAQMAPASEFTEQSLAEWHRRICQVLCVNRSPH